MSSQGMGPRPMLKKEMYSASASTATHEEASSDSRNAKYTAIKAAAKVMPPSDAASSARRPARSMSTTATPVITTWMAMTMTPPRSRSGMPAAARMSPEKKMTALMPENCCTSMTTAATLRGSRTPGSERTAAASSPTVMAASPESACAAAARASASSRARSPAPRSVSRDRSAASVRPRRTSHGGDSGMRHATTTSAAPRSAPSHASSRHLPRFMLLEDALPHECSSVSWGSRKPTRYTRKMPTVTASWLDAPSAPRRAGGAVSAMYTGTATEHTPTPSPSTSRAAIRTPADCAWAVSAQAATYRGPAK
mmetsp:Transcript_8350/g.25075  ORF Transcript_8350/g.25075 Transcript_8350/m.25075 type:complete len:310 (-) Transcript_8350:570-1499(-)